MPPGGVSSRMLNAARRGRKARRTRMKVKYSRVGRQLAVHKFCRMQATPFSITGNAAYNPYGYGQTFSLDQLVNNSEFTALFDFYRITHVQVKFFFEHDPGAQSAAAAFWPKLYTVIDHDDSNAMTTLNEAREHGRCQVRVLNPNRPTIINIKPSCLTEVYRSAITTSYIPKYRQWIDMAAPNVPHYGLKFMVDNFTNTNYSLRQEVKMWFECKDTR